MVETAPQSNPQQKVYAIFVLRGIWLHIANPPWAPQTPISPRFKAHGIRYTDPNPAVWYALYPAVRRPANPTPVVHLITSGTFSLDAVHGLEREISERLRLRPYLTIRCVLKQRARRNRFPWMSCPVVVSLHNPTFHKSMQIPLRCNSANLKSTWRPICTAPTSKSEKLVRDIYGYLCVECQRKNSKDIQG